jgi:hypothetical protein
LNGNTTQQFKNSIVPHTSSICFPKRCLTLGS